MEGTATRKLVRLVGNLAKNPHYLPYYLRDRLPGRNSPLELELPWFSYGAIDFLKGYLKPHMTVYEYGSGGSTLFFAKRVAQVTTIEDHPEWCETVRRKLDEKSLANVNLHWVKCDFSQASDFPNSEYLHALPKQPADVILIDSTEQKWPEQVLRPICFAHAENYIKPGGIIIVDDSWRYPYLREKNRASKVWTFESVGPARPGVTSTDIFVY